MSDENPIEVVHNMLRTMVSRKASDLLICIGFPPALNSDRRQKRITRPA